MTEREPGSLWLVRRGAAWEVARWQQEDGVSWWEIIGSEEGLEPDYWAEIGSRIYRPGEVSEDVERVARAIADAWHEPLTRWNKGANLPPHRRSSWDKEEHIWLPIARAAISALLTPPEREALRVAREAVTKFLEGDYDAAKNAIAAAVAEGKK